MAPTLSLSSIPPSVILALGQAFGIKDTAGDLDAAGHYDQALYQLLTWQGGDQTDTETGIPRLALVLKHVAQLMGSTAIPAELAKAARNPQSNVVPVRTEPEPEIVQPPKKRFTPDGFLILTFRPGEMLQTEQARERAGISKNRLAKLLQNHEFVNPAGVCYPGGDETKARIKVYYAVDVDKWRDGQILLGKKLAPKPLSVDALNNMKAAREKQDELPFMDYAAVKDGGMLTYDMLIDKLGCSRSHIGNLMQRGFPQPTARAKKPGAVHPVALISAGEVENWLQKSDEQVARAYRKAHADNDAPAPAPEVAPTSVGTFRNGAGGSPASRPDEEVSGQEAPTLDGEGEVQDAGQPKGWMSLRDVAEFLGTTETGVERLIRRGTFPKAHRQNSATHGREWGARQVIKWKAANAEAVT